MINVLIVDDDPMVAELNRRYLEQIEGYRCCGTVSNIENALNRLNDPAFSVDLVMLDIYLQHENGLDLLPDIRLLNNSVDVIVISSASDMTAIKKARNYGVVDYLIKPFQFQRFSDALIRYREEHARITQQTSMNQHELDALLMKTPVLLQSEKTKLPKGLTKLTLQSVWQWIVSVPNQTFSTEDLAAAVGISRVSCRKYLSYLAESGAVNVDIFYGTVGRPVYIYKLDPAKRNLMDNLLK